MLSGTRKQGPGADELKELFGYLSTSPITHMTYFRILMGRDQKEADHALAALRDETEGFS